VFKDKPKITIIDLLLGALIIAAGIYIVYKVSVGLNYRWNWGAIPQYFVRFDPDINHRTFFWKAFSPPSD
jgi:polar amino acid transport system permease protein